MHSKNEFNNVLIFAIFIMFLLCFIINNDDKYCFSNYQPNYLEELNMIKEEYDLLNQKYNYIPAEVINLSVNRTDKLFVINKGFINNVKNNSFVVNSDGLVGVVIKTYKRFSIVKSILSNDIVLPVEVNNCYGTITNKDNKIIVKDLINCNNVEIGDNVFTSKYNYSSSNILIGNIKKISKDNFEIKTIINPYKIKYVGVINDS